MPLSLRMDRRTLLRAALVAALARPSLAGAAQGEARPPGDEAFLNRLTFGATPAERDALAALGRAGWLDDQLARGPDHGDIGARLAALRLRIAYEAGEDEKGSWPALDELRPLAALIADPASLAPLLRGDGPLAWPEKVRPADEVLAASLPRAVHAPAQLREVMTQFWHDHFNVHAWKDEWVSVLFPQHDRALREHALGSFRDLLGAVARSPAMLVYLNNSESRASPANENFARELLELHTLGAGAYLNDRFDRWREVPLGKDLLAEGYIDEDVYEVARALTGWTVAGGQWIAEGDELPWTLGFHYVPSWHDPYQKRVLGREMPPNRGPMEDGDAVLDLLARHPATARHLCTKIARRLLADDPDPGLVDRLVAVWTEARDGPDQIAQVVRALALDPAFDAPPSKLRRPFEYLAALYRAAGAEVAPPHADWSWHLSRAGWTQHAVAPPTGHPDRTEDWSSSAVLLRTVDLSLNAFEAWMLDDGTRAAMDLPAESCGALADAWAERLHGPGATAPPEHLAALGAAFGDPLPEDVEERRYLSAMLVALLALDSRFLFR